MTVLSRLLPPAGEGRSRPWATVAATALSYASVGWLALMLAGTPGYASPLYPSAGIALAATLTWGWAAIPGVWLGAFAVNAGLGAPRAQSGLALLLLPAAIACGAALQAAVGAALVRRFAGVPLVLNAPRDIAAAGFFGALLACTISTSVATPALLAAGTLNADSWLASWLIWWVGDMLGVLVAAPLVLTLIGRPQADWRPRRLTLGLPLLLALLLLATGLEQLSRLNEQRVAAAFEREADQAASRVQARLKLPLHALKATHGAVLSAPRDQMATTLHHAASWWLAQDMPLQSVSYLERVPLAGVAAFEAQARQQGLERFAVYDRDDGSARAADREVLALRLVEPATGNLGALGVNVLSVPAPRAALARARSSGEPTATGGFKLAQSDDDDVGLVIYQPLYEGEPDSDAERDAAYRGAISVAFRVSALVMLGADGVAPLPSSMHWCLFDPDPAAARRLLAGFPGCADAARQPSHGALATQRVLQLADRKLELLLTRDAASAAQAQPESQLLLALSGLSAAAMLGALLLIITGKSRRTELAVQAGTATLRREIDERGDAEEALRESEQRLRLILDNVPLGVVFLDPAGRLIDANPHLTRMIGKPLETLRGQRLDAFVVAGDRQAMRAALDELVAAMRAGPGDAAVRRTLHFSSAAGRPTSMRLSAVRLDDVQGRLRRIVAVVEDITEHQKLEASEQARQRAEASDRAKSEFVSRMSHELRTPLNAMMGFAQLLGLDRDPALVTHQREWAQQIQRAGWHLLEMINDTLDLARIESGSVSLTMQSVALAPLVAAAQGMVSAAAREQGVLLRDAQSGSPERSPGSFAAQADPTRLRQILTNLLSNAVKYNRAGGEVGVTLRSAADGMLEVIVADTGLGMTETQMQALFQPYNRLGREASSIEGTGIGLVISRRLAELMGGSLDAISAAGAGSAFILRLPRAAGDVQLPPQALETGPAPYRQRSVHYIEDNETNVEVMRGLLLQRPQVALSVSTNGLDGVQAVRRLRPDLVLLDMGLPDISGLELLRHLKQDDEVAGIPVIVVSADATVARVEEALTLGALHYVTKPLDIARFLAVIDEALEVVETRWGM